MDKAWNFEENNLKLIYVNYHRNINIA